MSKADNKPAEEMSMEDILASIRKMIAQDQDGMDASRAERHAPDAEDAVADDEVLDLIEELPEDVMPADGDDMPVDPAPAWHPPQADFDTAEAPLELDTEFEVQDGDADGAGETVIEAGAAAESWTGGQDASLVIEPVTVGLTDMMEPVDAAAGDAGGISRLAHEAEPASPDTADLGAPGDVLAEPTLGEPVAVDEPVTRNPRQEPVSMDTPTARILSPEAAVKTSTAFDQLARTLVAGYEGDSNTLEGLVRVMLKPLLKEWLDANLPKIVEDMVQAEIRRLSR